MASIEPKPGPYRWYVLAVLIGVYMMHHVDRIVFSLLQEPIKHEFNLTDSQLALVSGTVFAVSFGIAGLPLGYLADRMRRTWLLGIVITLWSGLTALASTAQVFSHLLLARIGIGAAESGSTPTNLSILSDYFKDKRSMAIGFYMMGPQLGTLVGFALTGLVAAEFGWRAALLAAGIPGLFLVLIVLFSVREPARSQGHQPISMTKGLGEILGNPVLFHIISATTIANVVAPGLSIWLPSLIMRAGGQDIGWTGVAIGLSLAPVGVLGTILAGLITERVAATRPSRMAAFMALCSFLYIPTILFAVAGSPWMMLLGFAGHIFLHMFVSTPGYAMAMSFAPPNLRGTTGALMQVLSNLIGFGVGPLVGGALSDFLRPQFGDDSLRYALGIYVFLALWPCYNLLRASHLLRKNSAPNAVNEPA